MDRRILLSVFCFIAACSAWSQTSVPADVYQRVEAAIADRAADRITAVLVGQSTASWYPRLEAYMMKRARQLIIDDDLELARVVALALVDANLDNREAVDLYQSVKAALAQREEARKREEERRAVAAFKQKEDEERAKQEIAQEFNAVTNLQTGQKVYLDKDVNQHYRRYNWDFNLGLANLSYTISPDEPMMKYGVSAFGSFFYLGESFSVGVDAEGSIMLLGISGDPSLNWSGNGILSVANNGLSRHLVLRGGYGGIALRQGTEEIGIEELLFLSPILGLGVRDVPIGRGGWFQFAVDYYPGHLMEQGMAFAMGGNILASFVLAEMQEFNVHLSVGIYDTILLRSEGLVNDARLAISIGVGVHE